MEKSDSGADPILDSDGDRAHATRPQADGTANNPPHGHDSCSHNHNHDHDGCSHRHDVDAGAPRPDVPFVSVSSVSDALDWYVRVFDVEICAATDINDEMVHAEISFGQGTIQLGDSALIPRNENSEAAVTACTALTLTCGRIDVVMATARDENATCERIDLRDDNGFAEASFQDPFGIRWTLTTRLTPLILRHR